jgi:hypothetical protein
MRLVHASPGDKIPAASCHLYLFPPPYHVMSRGDRREDIFLGQLTHSPVHFSWKRSLRWKINEKENSPCHGSFCHAGE